MSDPRPFDMPPVSAGFDARGGWVVNRLMAEPTLGLTNPIHAAAIVGNLGGESGLEAINERHPIVPGSRGGWSWAQWTGSRRDEFEAYAAEKGLPLDSDQVAYEFLVKELLSTEAHALQQTKKTTALDAAVYTFEVLFERPSDPEGGLPGRVKFAQKAIAAAGHQIPNAPSLPPVIEPVPVAPVPVPVAPIPVTAPAVKAAPGVMVATSAGATTALAAVIQWLMTWPLAAPTEAQSTAIAGLIVVAAGGIQHLWQSKKSPANGSS